MELHTTERESVVAESHRAKHQFSEPPGEDPSATSPLSMGAPFWLAFSSLCITNLAVALEVTTLSVALPTISKDIGGTALDTFWAGTSYLLASTATMLILVSLSDGFGRRSLLVFSLALFAIGSVVGAVARNFATLIAGRTIQGTGGGGLLSLTVVVITDLVPLKDRGHCYAIISIAYSIGSIAGPVVGGALTSAGQWRWIFWMNLPIVAIALVGIVLFLKLNQRERSLASKLREVDYFGFVAFIASLTAFLIPITWGGIQYPWSSWRTLVPLLLGATGLTIFVLYEKFFARTPFIPMSIFSNYTVYILYAGSLVHGIVLTTIAYYMPEYYQGVKAYSPVISGVAALPQTVTVVPSAALVGFVVAKTKRYRILVWTGWALLTFGVGLLILLDIDITIPEWIFLTSVSGFGLGVLFPALNLALQASVNPESIAMSATLVIFFRGLGQTVGVAIGSSILQNRMQVELSQPSVASVLPLDAEAFDAISLVGRISELRPDSPLTGMLKGALVNSFQVIWAVICGLSGTMLLAHLAMREFTMDQEHITDQNFIGDKT